MGRRLVAFSIALAVLALCLCVALAVLLPRIAERSGVPEGQPTGGSDWYEVWFTTPRYPDRAEDRQGGIDEHLVAFVDGAQRSLDVAIYDFDLQNVATALARAKGRGVTVRLVTDTDTVENDDRAIQGAFETVRRAGIPVVPDKRGAIMHHKFVVRDGEAVWTGSYNFTTNDTFRHNNNALVIQSPQVAANYAGEFDQMFVRGRFGPNKTPGVPNPRVTLGGATIDTFFAPQDKIAARVVAAIRQARSSIYFMAFQFTNDEIGQAMIDRSRDRVQVAGVFERTGSETQFSEFRRLQEAGIEVYQDGNPYIMHHKVIVIDERIVLTGSYNFTDNAERSNDENLLFIEDAGLARKYIEEFNRVRETAKRPPSRP
ncbi:MAG: phospholipase D-like domain-containing protein [Dehalococcoidia bacterium]